MGSAGGARRAGGGKDGTISGITGGEAEDTTKIDLMLLEDGGEEGGGYGAHVQRRSQEDDGPVAEYRQ